MAADTTNPSPMATDDLPPACFGDPERVCPKDEQGIIQPQEGCLPCKHLKKCLQQALCKEGMIVNPDREHRVVSKATTFIKRWSDRKLATASGKEPGQSR